MTAILGTVTTKTTGGALRRFVRGTQASDWDALDQALRDAINGVWSMATSNLAARIVAAARLVGPMAPKSVPWRLVSGGVYDAVLDAGDVPHPSLTPEFVAKTDARMAEYGPVGPAAVDRIAIAAYLGNGDTFDGPSPTSPRPTPTRTNATTRPSSTPSDLAESSPKPVYERRQ